MDKKYKRYTPEIRAEVLSALLEGQAISKVSDDYKIPLSTIQNWRKRERQGAYGRSTEVGDMLVVYMQKSLEALTKQAEKFADFDWLDKQSASELAVLHGVMTDKVIRILEAYGKAGNDRD